MAFSRTKAFQREKIQHDKQSESGIQNIAAGTSLQTTSSHCSGKTNRKDVDSEIESTRPDVDSSKVFRDKGERSLENGPNRSRSSSTSQITVEAPENFPDGGLRAYLVVLGSFLGLTVVYGFLNSIGVLQLYLQEHQLSQVSTSKTSMIFAVYILLAYSLSMPGGIAFDELGPRITIFAGTVFLFLGMFFTGSCKSMPQFIGTFGIVSGIGFGICSGPLAAVVSHWFLRKRSQAFALATLGDSVGGIIFPLILTKLFLRMSFAWAMRLLSFIFLALLVFATLLVKGRSREIRSNTDKSLDNLPIKQKAEILYRKSTDFSSLKEPEFFFCTLAICFSETGLVCMATYFPSYVTTIGYSESKANLTMTIMNCIGILGRYIPGVIADIVGPFNVMIVMMACTCITVWIIWLLWSSYSWSLTSVYVYSVIYGFFNCAVLSLAPSCIAAISKTSVFGQRYGTCYLITGIFVFGGLIAGGAIISSGAIQDFRRFIIYCGALYTASVICYLINRYQQVGLKLKVKV